MKCTKRISRIIALSLAAMLVFLTPAVALAEEYVADNQQDIIETESTEIGIIELNATAEDGMSVKMLAEPDAFESSEGLELEALLVEEDIASDANDELTKSVGDENVAKRVTYDIRVMHDGEEIQPVNDSKVKLEFVMAEIPTGADAVSVFHHDIVDGIEVLAENIPVNQSEEDTVEKSESGVFVNVIDDEEEEEFFCDEEIIDDVTVDVVTDSFSLYTVDFTYKNKTVGIEGDSSANLLSTILEQVDIEGEILFAMAYQNAACTIPAVDGEVKDGDKVLFKVYETDGEWYVDAVNPFDTTHGLIVTMTDESEYQIKVTDAIEHRDAVTNQLMENVEQDSGRFKYDGKYYNVGITGVTNVSFSIDGGKTLASGSSYQYKDATNSEIIFYYTEGSCSVKVVVNKRNVLIKSRTSTTMEAREFMYPYYDVKQDGFVDGEGVNVKFTGVLAKNKYGSCENAFVITGYYPNTNPNNYIITTEFGKLTKTKQSSAGSGGGGGGGGGGVGADADTEVLFGVKNASTPIVQTADGSYQVGSAIGSMPLALYSPAEQRSVIGAGGKANWGTFGGYYQLYDAAGQLVKSRWALVSDNLTAGGKGNVARYYFDENGYMAVGTRWIQDADGKFRQYYFHNERGPLVGACLRGGTIGNITVNENGQVVENGIVKERDSMMQ